MSTTKLTDEQLTRAKKLYQDGMSIEEIASLLIAEETEIEKETERLQSKKPPWDDIKLAYETGFPVERLAERYSISVSTIKNKAKLNDWSIDAATTVAKKAEARLAGLPDPAETVEKQREVVEKAADEKAGIILAHRAEWRKHREWTETINKDDDIGEYRKAKLAAETIKLRQAGERAAWGFEDVALGGPISISWEE